MRAAIMARVSTVEQAEADRHSLPFQLSLMREYVTAKGWELVRTFEIPGESAFKDYMVERPQFGAAIGAAMAREFDVLVVYDLTRFARNQAVLHEALRDLRGAGVALMVWSGDWDATADRTRAGLEGIIAESHSLQHSARVRHAYRRRFEQGLPTGDVPFGYVRGASTTEPPIVVPDEAEAIRWGFEQYALGVGYMAIASEWNGRGLRPRSKRGLTGFTVSSVQSVLESRFYVGMVSHLGEERVGRHEAIVSEELWRSAQLRVRRHVAHRRPTSEALLLGMAECASCGGPVWSKGQGELRKDGSRRLYYWEPSKVRGRECASVGRLWRCELADGELAETLSGMRFEGEWLDHVSRAARVVDDGVSVRRARESVMARRRRVDEVYMAGGMEREEWIRRVRGLDEELGSLPVAEPARMLAAGERLGGFAEAWGEWTMAERREVVRLLFERVRLDVGGGVLEVKPREEFRELFAARRDYVHTKCGTTPDRSGTSFLTSGWFDHVADLRAG